MRWWRRVALVVPLAGLLIAIGSSVASGAAPAARFPGQGLGLSQ